ncbi:GNAT family N-acetyltransferase [Methanolobus psychrotolerans]|uniref:GNAT family N-acetyltransferase n=1 Tax=Methanolobus psychrotolerans TaxID=1874706 RepID=UPI000B9157C4|nr:GNAT family N-acetyltransferase [Methanolobus psychrotolerans]
MSERGDFQIRKMKRSDVDIAIMWAEEEGWNPGINDAECFYAADPFGFFIGELDDEPICCMSNVIYDDMFAFAGFYVVNQEYRNQGYGNRLFAEAMSYAGNRNIGGDGVMEMQEKYQQRSGFTFAYCNIRFEGIGGGKEPAGLVPVSEVQFDALADYDSLHFPSRRENFLHAWLSQKGCNSFVKLDKSDAICGYGVIRPCFTGFKIGPLFASDPEIAEDLFNGLLSSVGETPVFFDVPEPNRQALDIAKAHGMTKVFETCRMYTKEVPKLPINNIFGVTSFELG